MSSENLSKEELASKKLEDQLHQVQKVDSGGGLSI